MGPFGRLLNAIHQPGHLLGHVERDPGQHYGHRVGGPEQRQIGIGDALQMVNRRRPQRSAQPATPGGAGLVRMKAHPHAMQFCSHADLASFVGGERHRIHPHVAVLRPPFGFGQQVHHQCDVCVSIIDVLRRQHMGAEISGHHIHGVLKR